MLALVDGPLPFGFTELILPRNTRGWKGQPDAQTKERTANQLVSEISRPPVVVIMHHTVDGYRMERKHRTHRAAIAEKHYLK